MYDLKFALDFTATNSSSGLLWRMCNESQIVKESTSGYSGKAFRSMPSSGMWTKAHQPPKHHDTGLSMNCPSSETLCIAIREGFIAARSSWMPVHMGKKAMCLGSSLLQLVIKRQTCIVMLPI